MFTPRQYRARADEYSELIKGTDKPDEIREFQRLEHSFTELADNGTGGAFSVPAKQHKQKSRRAMLALSKVRARTVYVFA